ncbi:MAG: adenylate/guanylate cyclase domain-containing protein [Leptospira sp.]|nr:adenylate/guanylate cyclase domain-containing protein [Leptospira sp.]
MKLSKLQIAGIIVFFPLLLTSLLKYIGAIDSLENKSMDWRFKYANPGHKLTDKLVVVDIDETALSAYAKTSLFGRWPWKRSVYAPILEYIAAGNPKLIVFDIMFFEESPEDASLIQATENLGMVSHAINLNKEELTLEEDAAYLSEVPPNILKKAIKPENIESLNIKAYNVILYPANKLGKVTPFIHAVTYTPDEDGVARRGNLLFRYKDYYLPSLAYRAYDSQNPIKKINVDHGKFILESENAHREIPLEDGSFRLAYYDVKTLDNMPRYSISGIIDSIRALESGEVSDLSQLKVPPNVFEDKVIIIGTSAASTYDTRLTPYGDRPGFTFHAVFFSNLMENHILKMAKPWVGLMSLLIFLPFVAYMNLYSKRIALRIALPLSFMFFYPILAFLLFKIGIHIPIAEFSVGYPIGFLGSLAYLTLTEGAEKRKYSKVLSNMVDPTIVSEALNDLEALKRGGEMEITAFFSDVAGFSNISEQLSSKDLAALLNEYLSAMTIILKHNKGTLDKYIGDAVVGIFGAPIERKAHFVEAANASLEMIDKLKDLKQYWKANNLYIKDAQEMTVRIGLNTGLAKVGFMGTENLASYTMMGDTVNLAARLEAAAKDYGVHILISESTNNKVSSEMFTRELDAVRVKGKREPVRIYELISVRGKTEQHILDSTGLYEEGFKLYLARNWKSAITKFEESSKAKGQKDKAVEMLIERCQFYLADPPEDMWDGVFTRTHK